MKELMLSIFAAVALSGTALHGQNTIAPPMAADATPAFEVAAIKPGIPDSPGRWIRMKGRNFSTLNTSLSYLITFAYGVHARQITGGPGWLEAENYDLAGIPDKPGSPDLEQVKTMVRKLLADRFGLAFHYEKKELAVYAVAVAKTGAKFTKSEVDPSEGAGLGFRGTGTLLPVTRQGRTSPA